ncbi:hypothetical protein [Methylobacterium sp. J-092]|uniref:HPr kinase/phosphorylase n=1 Tax=Methylobacterium sp. J-092 TaxID=2836667 RepID=UPI0028C412ED|nr:hypothetical protein [Methylobacterium sp. J-092]
MIGPVRRASHDATDAERVAVHATCVVVGEAGVLLRGEAGAGKSSLALALIERATLRGGFAALVGDDRVRLARCHGRVVARPHPAIAGRIEIRGHGIVAVESVEACVLRLVVDLVAGEPRLPDAPDGEATILRIALPTLRIDRAVREAGLAPGLVLAERALAGLSVSSQSHTALPVDRTRAAP